MEWLAQQSGSGSGSWMQMLMWMVPLFIIMYVLMIRPQKLKEKKRKEMLGKLKKNDRVVTIGGMQGIVVVVKEREIILKVDESSNTRLKFTRSAIARILSEDGEEEEDGA